ncbi:hypothetical protein MTO96_045812 [Rhipicephalus appendiculatus]
MKIGCVGSKQFEEYDLCWSYSYLLGMLQAKNVSLIYRVTSNWSTALLDLHCENTDMTALLYPFNERVLAAVTYSEIQMVSETFYALAGNTQAPSLMETTQRPASTFAAAAASLTICAGLLVIIGGPPLRNRAQSATLFLLAVLLATSTPFPEPRRWPRVQNALCLIWALAMVPLSQYFRCELTSLVTVGLPARDLDTLDELEAAVGRGSHGPVRSERVGPLRGPHELGPADDAGEKTARVPLETRGPTGKGQLALLLRLAPRGPMAFATYLAGRRRFRPTSPRSTRTSKHDLLACSFVRHSR